MKTITVTALMATLVLIPFFLRRRRESLIPVLGEDEGYDDPRRHDLFDFMS